MADTAWKDFERRVCSWWSSRRRGPDYRSPDGGKDDCANTPGYSVEVKLLSRPTYGEMVSACKQSEKNRKSEEDIPVAVVKKKGRAYLDDDSLVIIQAKHFKKHFLEGKHD